jgi:hypothetical protein
MRSAGYSLGLSAVAAGLVAFELGQVTGDRFPVGFGSREDMGLGPLDDVGVDGANSHPDLIRFRCCLAEDRRATGLAEILHLARRGFEASEIVRSRQQAKPGCADDAVGGKCAALGLAALGAMAIHDMANRLCDLEADSATKTSSCVHTHLAFWVIHSLVQMGSHTTFIPSANEGR